MAAPEYICPECGSDDIGGISDPDYRPDPGEEPESRCRNCGHIAPDSAFG